MLSATAQYGEVWGQQKIQTLQAPPDESDESDESNWSDRECGIALRCCKSQRRETGESGEGDCIGRKKSAGKRKRRLVFFSASCTINRVIVSFTDKSGTGSSGSRSIEPGTEKKNTQ